MATFYGGEQLIRRLVFRDSDNNFTDRTIYTCPTGRYAKAFIRKLDGFEVSGAADLQIKVDSDVIVSGDFNSETIKNNTIGLESDINFGLQSSDLIEIDAGQQLILNGGNSDTVEWDFVVMEYALPWLE